jgi:hypothetical protein
MDSRVKISIKMLELKLLEMHAKFHARQFVKMQDSKDPSLLISFLKKETQEEDLMPKREYMLI